MIEIKEGVSLAGLGEPMTLGVMVVASVYDVIGKPCVITSVLDGVHGRQSLHYQGGAVDFRTRHLSENEKLVVDAECRAALSAEFDVVMEHNHLHVEWQPKRG